MTKKVYKTAQGKTVDMGALILRNESTRAVGNMAVNARGDVLSSTNTVVEKSTQRTSKQYSKQVSNVTAGEVNASSPRNPKPVKTEAKAESTQEATVPQSGLAAAMSRAQASKKQKPTGGK